MFGLFKKKFLPITDTNLTLEQKEYALRKIKQLMREFEGQYMNRVSAISNEVTKRRFFTSPDTDAIYRNEDIAEKELKAAAELYYLKDSILLNKLTTEDLRLLNEYLMNPPKRRIDFSLMMLK